jgi:hypothetical protein
MFDEGSKTRITEDRRRLNFEIACPRVAAFAPCMRVKQKQYAANEMVSLLHIVLVLLIVHIVLTKEHFLFAG